MNTMSHPTSKRINHHGLRSKRGFSLVELMIAIALGLTIMAALMTLFVNLSRNNKELAKTNILIENGRFTIQLLESDLVHAGFWGGYIPDFDDLTTTTAPGDTPTAIPDPCLTYSTANWNSAYKTNLIGIPVQSYDTAAVCTSLLVNKLADTDVLVVRHVNTCVPGETNCEADTSGELYFQSTNCTASPDPYVLDTSGYTLTNRDCTTVADKRKFISHIYYIRDYASTVGDGTPTLMRSEFSLSASTLAHQAAVPLIEGVEGFRVEFGIDSLSKTGAAVDYSAAVAWTDISNKHTPTNRGDGAADGAFVRCTTASPCTAAQLTNVVAAKLYVLARAPQFSTGYTDSKTYTLGGTTLGPFNDSFKRHVFSTTVRLNNISGRRETP